MAKPTKKPAATPTAVPPKPADTPKPAAPAATAVPAATIAVPAGKLAVGIVLPTKDEPRGKAQPGSGCARADAD